MRLTPVSPSMQFTSASRALEFCVTVSVVHPLLIRWSIQPGLLHLLRVGESGRNAPMNSALPRRRAVAGAAAVATGLAMLIAGPGAGSGIAAAADDTATPIKHLVVIFQENVSFDHYFGTYPNATNTSGQPFSAARGAPSVNGLSGPLLTNNPNGVNPRRYDPTNINDVLTCDQDHNYNDEQRAFDNEIGRAS